MDRHELELYYQPIVDLGEHATDRFEAFVRWRHPTRGMVAPNEFLPDLEEIGLMVRLGHWVIGEVCRQIANWKVSYDGAIQVSVNLSHREFTDPGLLPHILDCLSRHGLAPSNITLEITEGVLRRKSDAAFALIEELHAAGIGVQIGGLGTGMSSLHALHLCPIQALKIDREFIRDLDVDPRTAKLVQMIVDIGRSFGFDVVAEGVETDAQLSLLREMGCRTAQGFLFTEAVDAEAAGKLLGRSLAEG